LAYLRAEVTPPIEDPDQIADLGDVDSPTVRLADLD
jgi:hypothetical protein